MTVEQLRKMVEDKKYLLSKDDIKRFCDLHKMLIENEFGKEILTYKGGYNFKEGIQALSKSTRLVIGSHGPYVEFDKEDACFEMEIPEDQKWRLDEKYSVKYVHYQPIRRKEKIYLQKGLVKYADYMIGKCYIDFYVLNCSDGVKAATQH